MVDSATGMLTLKEVARELDRSLEQVRRYVREGKLAARKIGMQWFVAPSDLANFKAGRNSSNRELPAYLKRAAEIREKIRAEHGMFNASDLVEESRRDLL